MRHSSVGGEKISDKKIDRGYRCKCYVTGETGNTKNFLKAEGKYFKNEETYHQYRREIDAYNKAKNMFYVDFLGYKSGQPFSSIGVKELNELRKFYGGEVLLATLEACHDDIEYFMKNKCFKNETGQTRYALAIIKNNINDINKRIKAKKKREKDLEIKVDSAIFENAFAEPHVQKTNDISMFVEED